MRLDDALDVIAVHFIGGVLGSLLLGFFGSKAVNAIGADGLFYGGGGSLLGEQALAVVVVVAFSFVVTWLIAMGVEKTIGLRVEPADEDDLDLSQQAMSAYAFDRGAGVTQATAPEPAAAESGEIRLITAIVDHDDADELRLALLQAGASSIVLSEASVYGANTRTEVISGHRRAVEFAPRLRLEVLVAEQNVARIAEAIDALPGASQYVQVGQVRMAATSRGRHRELTFATREQTHRRGGRWPLVGGRPRCRACQTSTRIRTRAITSATA